MARTACLVCFISAENGHCNKKKKLTLGRPALVVGTQQTLSSLFWDFRYLWLCQTRWYGQTQRCLSHVTVPVSFAKIFSIVDEPFSLKNFYSTGPGWRLIHFLQIPFIWCCLIEMFQGTGYKTFSWLLPNGKESTLNRALSGSTYPD
jgi:hypothetical protein